MSTAVAEAIAGLGIGLGFCALTGMCSIPDIPDDGKDDTYEGCINNCMLSHEEGEVSCFQLFGKGSNCPDPKALEDCLVGIGNIYISCLEGCIAKFNR